MNHSIGRKWAAGLMAAAALTANGWAASPELEKAVVSDAPSSGTLGVVAAKAQVKDGDRIVVEGRVKDFVNGQAVFTMADKAMKSCKDNGEDCPTPWDYCCETKETITKNTATVKLVGPAGGKKALKEGLKGVKGLDNLTLVAVEGIAQKDKAGNLIVLAERIHVKK